MWNKRPWSNGWKLSYRIGLLCLLAAGVLGCPPDGTEDLPGVNDIRITWELVSNRYGQDGHALAVFTFENTSENKTLEGNCG